MIETEGIREERRKDYEEKQRILLARLMSEKGGMLMEGATDAEIERKQQEFIKDMITLQYKYIDVVREDYGLNPDDNRASFGEDMEKRWDHFFKSSMVLDDKGEDTILYKDAEDNYRLIPDCCPRVDKLEFVVKNMPKVKTEIPKEELEMLPSLTILGIEAICSDKYSKYNVKWDDKDFFITQAMILTMELFDIIAIHKKYLKEESNNKLYQALEERYKEIF